MRAASSCMAADPGRNRRRSRLALVDTPAWGATPRRGEDDVTVSGPLPARTSSVRSGRRRPGRPRTASTERPCSAGAMTVAVWTSARIDCLASDFALRTPASASAAAVTTAGSPSAGSSAAVGHEARCTEPGLPPRPDLLGDERQHRREQPQLHRERERQRRLRGLAPPASDAVGPRLHQLDVVVAERPEERLRDLERPRVVERLERGGRLVDDAGQRRSAAPGRSAR